jgi:hypothetical protein
LLLPATRTVVVEAASEAAKVVDSAVADGEADAAVAAVSEVAVEVDSAVVAEEAAAEASTATVVAAASRARRLPSKPCVTSSHLREILLSGLRHFPCGLLVVGS